MILPGHDPMWRSIFPGQEIPDGARQPASVDLRLANEFYRPFDNVTWSDDKVMTIGPTEFVLGRTVEMVDIPATYAGRVEGKSSWGRRGLMVHATAGFLDPGFNGVITLEFVNVSGKWMDVPVGVFICQMSLTRMLYELPKSQLYRGRYQGATTVEGAKS